MPGIFQDTLGHLIEVAGDHLEEKVDQHLAGSQIVTPLLPERPVKKTWYRLLIPEASSGDGSDYHIYIKGGTRNRLCIFLSGGGVAWDEYTAARPVTVGKLVGNQPNFYWNNLRPITEFMNVGFGMMETNSGHNPFDDWCFIVITYATGDFHVGNNDFAFETEDGGEDVLHFNGHKNFLEGMKQAVKFFPAPVQLLIAGDSAGAFAVPALTPEIVENYYPDCPDVTLFSDSALLRFDGWRETARDVWKAENRIWSAIHTDNIVLDWYRKLYKDYGDRFRYLYACSTRDYLLSAYYNAANGGTYTTDEEMQEIFYGQLQELLAELKAEIPGIGLFLNDWKAPYTKGGTIHTAVRRPWFYIRNGARDTMAQWLFDAVHGRVYDVGLEKLEKKTEP